LRLAYDAFMLYPALGRDVSLGKIIHRSGLAPLKVETSAPAGEVRKATHTRQGIALRLHCEPTMKFECAAN